MSVWISIVIAGLVNYLSRLVSVLVINPKKMSERTKKILNYVPSAVFPAIIFPAVFLNQENQLVQFNDPKVIAILISLGAKNNLIKNIFLFFGFLIGSAGITIGLLSGLILTSNFGSIVSFIESLFGIQFMKVYFIDYFPIDIRWSWVFSICIISFLLASIASVYPAKIASKIEPAEALKYE